jgi:hypothetical protein
MPVIKQESLKLRLSDFNNIVQQHIRKQSLSPDLNPASIAERSQTDNSRVFTRPMTTKLKNNINK